MLRPAGELKPSAAAHAARLRAPWRAGSPENLHACAPHQMHAPPGVQVFLTQEYLGIVMDFATDGDMFQLVVRQRGLLEKDARWYFQQLITAVDYCHRMVRREQGQGARLPTLA